MNDFSFSPSNGQSLDVQYKQSCCQASHVMYFFPKWWFAKVVYITEYEVQQGITGD